MAQSGPSGPKWPKVAQVAQSGPNGPKWPKVAQSGPKWPKVAQSSPGGPKWPKWPKVAQSGPNCQRQIYLLENSETNFFLGRPVDDLDDVDDDLQYHPLPVF